MKSTKTNRSIYDHLIPLLNKDDQNEIAFMRSINKRFTSPEKRYLALIATATHTYLKELSTKCGIALSDLTAEDILKDIESSGAGKI